MLIYSNGRYFVVRKPRRAERSDSPLDTSRDIALTNLFLAHCGRSEVSYRPLKNQQETSKLFLAYDIRNFHDCSLDASLHYSETSLNVITEADNSDCMNLVLGIV